MHDTILHECAHALIGPDEGHGYNWKRMAIKVGAIPRACNVDKNVKAPEGPYAFICHCNVYYYYRSNVLGHVKRCRACKKVGIIDHNPNYGRSSQNAILNALSQRG
jgi:predicted SprT family Zn-dependent metalloprotease